MPVSRRLFVSGVVQGVGYRYFVLMRAQALGLSGWVRNLPDGRVEVLCRGDGVAVDQLVQALAHGPSRARVTDVAVAPVTPDDEFPQPFDVR